MRTSKILVTAAAIAAAQLGGGCATDDGEPPQATVAVAEQGIGTPIALSTLRTQLGLTSQGCNAGEHAAVVIAFDHPSVSTDMAIALPGRSVNRLNHLGQAFPLPSQEPQFQGDPWKKASRQLTQSLGAIAQGCVVDLYEALDASEANMGTASDTARKANPKVVLIGWGFPETSVSGTFKSKFAPFSANQAIVAIADKSGAGVLMAPGVYATTVSVGRYDTDALNNPIGLAGGQDGFSALESRPSHQPVAFTARRVPDVSGYGSLVAITVDGATVNFQGLPIATGMIAGLAALSATPSTAHLWTAPAGQIVDVVSGASAVVGPTDPYGLGRPSLTAF